MAGIKESLEVLELIGAAGSAAGRVYAKPDAGVGDIVGELVGLLPYLPAAIDGIGEIPTEAKDYSSEEIDEMTQFLVNKFDIPQDSAEEAIEDHLQAASAIAKLVLKYYA